MFFDRCFVVVIAHLDINERYYLGLKAVLRSFDHDDELLTHLGADLQRDLLLQFFSDWVLNEPAIELNLRVLDERAVMVLKRQLVTVVLAENRITIEVLMTRNGHGYDLLLITDICQKQC